MSCCCKPCTLVQKDQEVRAREGTVESVTAQPLPPLPMSYHPQTDGPMHDGSHGLPKKPLPSVAKATRSQTPLLISLDGDGTSSREVSGQHGATKKASAKTAPAQGLRFFAEPADAIADAFGGHQGDSPQMTRAKALSYVHDFSEECPINGHMMEYVNTLSVFLLSQC